MKPPVVLVVDDSADNRNLAMRMLKVIGASVADQAANAQECLEALSSGTYDTILMDISMPAVSGIDLCKTVRKMPGFESVRIIACTAHANTREAQRFHDAGFNCVLTKPFMIADLKQAIFPT